MVGWKRVLRYEECVRVVFGYGYAPTTRIAEYVGLSAWDRQFTICSLEHGLEHTMASNHGALLRWYAGVGVSMVYQ